MKNKGLWGTEGNFGRNMELREQEGVYRRHKLFKDYLFMYSCETQRGRVIGRGKMRLYPGSLMWDMIPQDPGIMTLAKADAKPLRHPGALLIQFLC